MLSVNPVILTAMELEVYYGEQVILDKASLSVHEQDRIGLIGRNGAGKSTFLKIISGLMPADRGDVAKKKELEVGFLSQEFTLDTTKDVYNNILDGAKKITELVKRYESLPFDSPEHIVLEKKIMDLDGWNLDKSIDLMMKALNAPEKDRDILTLSGGEKRRVALCRALISRPDLLILDEPTNHLDTNSIEWIENFLMTYEGTCIFVTHDRYFLDRIANRIVELTRGVFTSHQGNYTDYLAAKSERLATLETEERKRQNFLRRELEWVVRGPKARTTKSKSRLDKYYEVLDQSPAEKELNVDLVIPPGEQLGNKILELKNVGIDLGGKRLFESINFAFEKGRKLGVVGPNGIGKTTFLKVLLGSLKPTIGKVEKGDKTEFNYVDQSRLLLNDNDTVFNAISEGNEFVQFGKQQLNAWTYLRRFLFTDERINTLVGRLSGGERSRLTLARILKDGGNFIILDEPTNDLDLPTLRILEEALQSFEGVVVVVSHDRYFLNRVCNGILHFEGEGKTYFSEGDYDYFLEKKRLRMKDQKTEEQQKKKGDTRIKEQVRKLTWKEKKELETIEDDISVRESRVAEIENMFSMPDFYDKFGDTLIELNEELERTKNEIQKLYLRWDELEKIKEQKDAE